MSGPWQALTAELANSDACDLPPGKGGQPSPRQAMPLEIPDCLHEAIDGKNSRWDSTRGWDIALLHGINSEHYATY